MQIPSIPATYPGTGLIGEESVFGDLESLQGGIGVAGEKGPLTAGLMFEGGEIVQDFLPPGPGNQLSPNAAFLGSIPVPVLGLKGFFMGRWNDWGIFTNFAALWPLGAFRNYGDPEVATPVDPVFYRGEVGADYFFQPNRAIFISMNLLYCSLVELFWGPKVGVTFFF